MAQSPDSKELLERTVEKFKEAGGIKATFTIRTPDGTSTGEIYLKGEKFRLEAGGMTTWFDGRTQWSYLSHDNEVNISEPTPEELLSINPYAWLSLDKNGYRLTSGKSDNSLYKIVLTAADRRQDLQRIELYVAEKTLRPMRIGMMQRGGATTIVNIDSYQIQQNYPERFFVFDRSAYPTAEVIDLR